MATAISISDAPDETWTIQDRVFEWFASLVAEQYRSDPELVAEVELASAMNGVSLDVLATDNPELSDRLSSVLQVMANEVVDGVVEIPADVCESTARCRELFSDLAQILSTFESKRCNT